MNTMNIRKRFRRPVLTDTAKTLLSPTRLLKQDLRSLRSRYVSDWTLFNQQVFASAVYVFFTNLLPGITFASDLYVLTGKQWGTIEVVLSTGLCGVIFAISSIQPLTILGVTGPFSILAENIYSLCKDSFKISFLSFMAWCFIHSAWMHYLLAIFNAHDWTMRYVTTFSTEIFSLLNSIIYFHKAVQELQRAHANLSFAAFLYAIIGAVGTFLLAVFLSTAEKWAPLFHRYVRIGLAEYAAAISIVFFIGMPYVGELTTLDKYSLPVSSSFHPSDPSRSRFFVEFWTLPIGWMFAAIIPGAIITCLFYFDHEVSSIICTQRRYGTVKPGGFAWDIVLLGTTTAMCGILGVPPANGLLPQAPLHSESLLHAERQEAPMLGSEAADNQNQTEIESEKPPQAPADATATTATTRDGDTDTLDSVTVVVHRVYEQRWSPFLHAGGILAFTSPPLMHVLGLTPTSVLAGLFLFMGEQSLSVNPILTRTFHLLTPQSELPSLPHPLKSYWPIHGYTITQIVVTVIIFIITLTIAGPVFPILVIALVPVRLQLMNRIWSRDTLMFVDRWACRDGHPEDKDELASSTTTEGNDGADASVDVQPDVRRAADVEMCDQESIRQRDAISSLDTVQDPEKGMTP